MGFKALLYCSHTFYKALLETLGECLSRMEYSELFNSVEEEEAFLSQESFAAILLNLHKETISKVNGSSIVHEMYKEASMEEVLNEFWRNVKSTVIVRTPEEAAVIYGYNSNTCKYYGL